jgi:hypothetical protein
MCTGSHAEKQAQRCRVSQASTRQPSNRSILLLYQQLLPFIGYLPRNHSSCVRKCLPFLFGGAPGWRYWSERAARPAVRPVPAGSPGGSRSEAGTGPAGCRSTPTWPPSSACMGHGSPMRSEGSRRRSRGTVQTHRSARPSTRRSTSTGSRLTPCNTACSWNLRSC